jgi:hypothetical protein
MYYMDSSMNLYFDAVIIQKYVFLRRTKNIHHVVSKNYKSSL